MTQSGPSFFGKYRGIVTDNDHPNQLGRIRARVQDILGEEQIGWAMPAVPYAGRNVGFYMIPPRDALVWIEFEQGDPDYPIWSGCFWAQGELPVTPAGPDKKVIKTETGTITLDDTSGQSKIVIETQDGKKVVLDQTQIEITNGQWSVKLTSSSVSINDGALEVT